ncbi:Outer membrane receptor proteins, mostly Fe transport [Solimonas aquatica]|uniref:Outer membrane receptor proteins, mostly Fe transport n=1 Tax=Solimonas aquatica TaxID=489703 RepID=A0A1H9FZ12_9GAMM|nr:TonB-dependent receptor [Solimonas aquatica]SEQ43061.1 Outer membrane receptor proteins, mostly Fe transport [Solimonas aquatica]
MKQKLYRSTFCTAMVLGSGSALPAHAQDAAEAAAQAPAAAEAAPVAGAEIEEVLVTARRIQERLQDVPISMTVFDQSQLTDRNVSSARDLAGYTPSLQANPRFGTDSTSLAIRGFSQELRTTASVGMYFADVVSPRGGGNTPGGDGAGPGAFFDLQNVQVLKGPQGTLFGRNTTGGAVLLVPRKPGAQFEGYVEQSLGDDNLAHTTAIVNVPVNDRIRLRLGVDRNRRDGYLKNISGVGPKDFADLDYTAGRASLVVDLAPRLENYTILSASLSDTNGQLPRIFAFNPASGLSVIPVFNGAVSDQLAREQAADKYAVENDDPNARVTNRSLQGINTTTWTINDGLTLKNIASYAQLKIDNNNNTYGTNLLIPSTVTVSNGQGGTVTVPTGAYAGIPFSLFPNNTPKGLHSIDQWTATEEVQLLGHTSDNRINWQTGFYYEASRELHPNGSSSSLLNNCSDYQNQVCSDPIGDFVSQLQRQQPGTTLVGSLGWQVGGIEYRNIGIYGQADFKLSEALKLTAGLRYTKDQSTGWAEMARWRFAGSNDTPTLDCTDRQGTIVSSTSVCRNDQKKDSSAPTWLLGADYKLQPDWMLYGKYARGYRMGSVIPYAVPGYRTFDPEQVDSFELGSKTSFDGAIRGNFNVSLFYNKLKDQQLQYGFRSVDNSVAGNASIINAGASRTYGAEVESVLLPVKALRLSLSYAYLNTKLEKIDDFTAPGFVAQPPAAEGEPLPYTTKHKLSATAAYTLPLDASLGAVTASTTYTYQSDMFVSSSTNGPNGTVPSYGLFNLNLSWDGVGGKPVDIAFFATNLLDQYYRASVIDSWQQGISTQILGEPRMLGGRVRLSF